MIETLSKEITIAMKNKDSIRLNTLRLLKSEMDKEAGRKKLTENDYMAIVKRSIKGREETISYLDDVKDHELIKSETQSILILKEFLPEEVSIDEIIEVINQYKDKAKNSGQLTGMVLKHFKGQNIDGKIVADLIIQKVVDA